MIFLDCRICIFKFGRSDDFGRRVFVSFFRFGIRGEVGDLGFGYSLFLGEKFFTFVCVISLVVMTGF